MGSGETVWMEIPPAIGLARGQPGVDHRQDGDLLVILLVSRMTSAAAQAASAPVKNAADAGGSSREVTRPAVAWSQCPAWLSTSKPGNRLPVPDCRRW
jgi:hypothetical protein